MAAIPESFTAIDFETANSSHASACALGIVVVSGGRIVSEKSWLINPECKFHWKNIKIHGITERHVSNAPTFPEIWEDVLLFLENRTVCAHNLAFDNSVLQKSLARYCLRQASFESFCTLKESRTRIQGLESYRLNDLADELQLGAFKHHDALDDARMCAMLALRLRGAGVHRATN